MINTRTLIKGLILVFSGVILFSLNIVQAQNNTRPVISPPAATNMQINSYNGNLNYTREDIFIPGRGLDLEFTFSYNSSSRSANYGFGNGWTHNNNIYYENTDSTFSLIRGNGQKDVFKKEADLYIPPTGVFDKVEEYYTNQFLVTSKYGMKYYFDESTHKKITRIVDRNSNTLTFNYSAANLIKLTGPAGREITLNWTAGLCTSIVDAIDNPIRTYLFDYDDNDQMIQHTKPDGNTIFYGYDDNRRMVAVTDEASNLTTVGYSNEGTVNEVTTCITRQTIKYDLEKRTTTLSEETENGVQNTVYTFDENGRNVSRSGNCCGTDQSFEYDENDNVVSSTDGNGNTTTFTFDDKGNLISLTDPLGCTLSMTYSPELNQNISMTDKNGNTTNYEYDDNGNLLSIQMPLGITRSFSYDAFGNQVNETDGNGNTTIFSYDSYGFLTKKLYPLKGFMSEYSYDNRGNRISSKDENGNLTISEFDILGNKVSIQDPLGIITSFEYDEKRNRIKTINGLSITTSYFYDPLNRLIEIKYPLDITIQFKYDIRGNKIEEKDALGFIKSFEYNSKNKLIKEIDPLGNETSFAYDLNGNQIWSLDANGNKEEFIYDKLNRLIRKKDGIGSEIEYEYDCKSNLVKIIDSKGNENINVYDEVGRKIMNVDALAYITEFKYDKNGNILEVVDPNKNSTIFFYDVLDRRTMDSFSDSSSIFYEYDGYGNMISKIDNKGVIINYEYDSNNKLTKQINPNSSDDLYTYDGIGRMITAENENAKIIFEYDALNRILKETMNGFSTSYLYNNKGDRTIIYPSGNVITEKFNEQNLLSEIFDNNEILASFEYDEGARLVKSKYNDTMISFTYDQNNRVASIYGDPENFLQFNYSYDENGNLIFKEKNHNPNYSELFEYNSKNELVLYKTGFLENEEILSPIFAKEYTYDPLGNRKTELKNEQTINFSVNNMNEYSSITESQNLNLDYDQNGNLTLFGNKEFVYDDKNTLIAIVDSDTIAIFYDALGRRIKIIENGEAQYFYYANDQVIEVFSEKGLISSMIYGINFDEMIYEKKENEQVRYYYHELNQTTVLMLSDSIKIKYEYDDFGSPTSIDFLTGENLNEIENNKFLFIGRPIISSDLYYFRARYYHSKIGRFLNRDPIGFPDGYNFYKYANNNPVNNKDPLGLMSTGSYCKNKSKPIISDTKMCEESIKNNPNETSVGGWVACKGNKKTPCVDSKGPKIIGDTYNIDPTVVKHCTLVHENYHLNDNNLKCPSSDICVAARASSPETKKQSECQALLAELNCLICNCKQKGCLLYVRNIIHNEFKFIFNCPNPFVSQ